MRTLGDAQMAEDAAQATFLVLMQRAASLPETTILASWLYLTAQNCARNIYRAAKRRAKYEQEALAINFMTKPESPDNVQLDPHIDAAMAVLPEAQRASLILHYLQGMSYSETAQQMNCPEATVCFRVARGLEKLRDILKRRGITVAGMSLAPMLTQYNNPLSTPAGISGRIHAICIGKTAASSAALSASNSILKAMAFAKFKVVALTTLVAIVILVPVGYYAYRSTPNTSVPPGVNKSTEQSTVDSDKETGGTYSAWKNGPSDDPSYFPIGVWMQDPKWAEEYRDAGINVYVGMKNSPTAEELAMLRASQMTLICGQDAAALDFHDDKTISGWIDVEDYADHKKIAAPAFVARHYRSLSSAEPTHPVALFLPEGVDYGSYLAGCNIAIMDLWPLLYYEKEPRKTDQIYGWVHSGKPVWNLSENSLHNRYRLSPETEAWLGLVQGARGQIWYVHKSPAEDNDRSLLDNPQLLSAITAVNRRIRSLAPVLNAPHESDGVEVESFEPDVAVATTRHWGGEAYVFAVGLRDTEAQVTMRIRGLKGELKATVLDENRSIAVKDGLLSDVFEPHAVHLYRIK
jgi:RNA polymerase sigma factor (sigma-70 family)